MNGELNNFVAEFYQFTDNMRVVSTNDDERVQDLVHLLEPRSTHSFLDIGCYDGTKTQLLAQAMGAQRVCGMDFQPEPLAKARSRGIETKVVDLNANAQFPFDEQEFDCIFVGDVIEHLFSPDHLLQEIARLLRPGGYSILTTPNLASWRNRLVLLLGWQPFMTEVSTQYRVGNPLSPRGIPVGHIRVFTPPAMRELPSKYGLTVEYLGGQILPNPPIGWVSRVSQLVDRVCWRFRPTLCDELVVKLRKE